MSSADPLHAQYQTPYAMKYGNIQTRGGYSTNRSAWSPILPQLPALDFGNGDFQKTLTQGNKMEFDREREEKQRAAFYGFTTQELVELDCISAREMKESNLINPLLPFLEDENWEAKRDEEFERIALWEIAEDDPSLGHWTMHNPRVKPHVQPSVQAASRLLQSPDMLAFLEELVLADIRPVDLHRIQQRHHHLQGQKDRELLLQAIPKQKITLPQRVGGRKQLQKIFTTMKERLGLGFYPGDRDPQTGDPDENHSYGMAFCTQSMELGGKHGLPPTDAKATKFWAYIDFVNLVKPLLRGDLSHSERLGIQWFLTIVIVHELIHTIWRVHFWLLYPERCVDQVMGDVPEEGDTLWEAYWDQDPVSELGHHMEQLVFGGQGEPFLSDRPGGPLGYFIGQRWPTVLQSAKGVVLTSPRLPTTQIFWPLPVEHFQRIFQEEFWNVGIRSFGLEVMHTKHLTHGARVDYTQQNQLGRVGPEDIWRANPAFRICRNDFTPQTVGLHAGVVKLNHKYVLSTLAPHEMIAKVWGEHMIESAKLHTNYHDTVRQMNTKIQELYNATKGEAHTAAGPAQQRWAQGVLDGLDKAITAHVNVLRDLLTMEKRDHTTYSDWRSNMHSWNREVRRFVTQFVNACSDQQASNAFNAIAKRLEVARMGLYDNGPGDLQHGSGNFLGLDQEEWGLVYRLNNTLAQLNNSISQVNYAQYRNELQQLLDRQDLTLFVRSLADLLEGNLPREIRSKQPRLQSLNLCLHRLSSLRNHAPAAWHNYLDAFINNARATIMDVDSEDASAPAALGLGSGSGVRTGGGIAGS